MQILVTGGAGYLGSRVVAHLVAQGHTVRVLDRLLYGGEALLTLTALPGIDLRVGDVRDRKTLLDSMSGVDAVVHMAGIVGEAACNVAPGMAWSINHDAIDHVLAAAQDTGAARLVFVSTCSNYGVAEPNAAVDEDAPLNPLSEYARAKVDAERKVLAIENPSFSVTVLRLGTICGVSARMRFDLLVNELARDAVLERPIEIYAPAAWRPFLHIDDAGPAIDRVLAASPSLIQGRVFNVVGENHQKYSLIDMARRLKPSIEVTMVDRKPDLRDYRVSGERFVNTLGFRAARTVESAFTEVAAAVGKGLFRDPTWPGHSAVPLAPFVDAA